MIAFLIGNMRPREGRQTSSCDPVAWQMSMCGLPYAPPARSVCFLVLVLFHGALRPRRRSNIALITTLPVLGCLNVVQHLQPRCLEDRLSPQQGTQASPKQSRFSPRFPTLAAQNGVAVALTQKATVAY